MSRYILKCSDLHAGVSWYGFGSDGKPGRMNREVDAFVFTSRPNALSLCSSLRHQNPSSQHWELCELLDEVTRRHQAVLHYKAIAR